MYTEASASAMGVLESRGGFTNPQIAELRYVAANAFFEVSNYDKAIEIYKSIAQVDPNSSFGHNALYNLARAYYNKKMYAESIDILRPIVNLPQYRENSLWLMAEAASEAKKTELAVQNYRMLANEFPNGEYADDAIYRIGCVYRAAGQREEAVSAFLQLSEKYPKSPFTSDALFFAAHSLTIDQDERALGLLKRFVKEHSGDPKVPAATYHIAVEENRRGNNTEALDAFILIYSAYPQSEYAGEAYLWSGSLFSEKGELAQAEKNFRKALTYKLSVDSEQQAKFMLAIVLQKQKKEDESIAMMKELLDNNVAESFSPQHLAWLSRSLIDRKLWGDAEKAAVKLASDANMSNAWKQTGWALAAKAAKGAGKNNEAESYYRNALSCDAKTRDYIECCYLLGELLMQRKNFVEAEERFAEAARLSVDMPEFNELRIYSYIGHGHSAIAQGKRNEGIRLLIAASLLFSHDTLLPPVMEEVISLLKEEGRNDEAKSVREDLIRMYPNSEEAKRCAAEAN
jgi:TolA-binding protein